MGNYFHSSVRFIQDCIISSKFLKLLSEGITADAFEKKSDFIVSTIICLVNIGDIIKQVDIEKNTDEITNQLESHAYVI